MTRPDDAFEAGFGNIDTSDAAQPFRATAGFYAFVVLMLLPALVALAIFSGAWLVSDEVHAAEEAEKASRTNTLTLREAEEVPGWKRSLVALCPVH